MESSSNLDYTKMLEMCLVHDLPEIYSGDIFPFGNDFNEFSKKSFEKLAADKLFNFLDGDLKKKFINLYGEYSSMESNEAQIVKAIDKIQPDHLNLILRGGNWNKYNLTYSRLFEYKHIFVVKNKFTEFLYYDFILNSALEKGYLKK